MKKYLIHIDGCTEQFLYTLFFIHIVNMTHDDVEVNLLLPQSIEFDYSLLSPFEVKRFFYNETEIATMPRAHKFAYNLHEVFNIDCYIDFLKTNTSAFLGAAFKATEKLGHGSVLRNLLLTKGFQTESSEALFNEILKYFHWNFELENVQKEFSPAGDGLLLFNCDIESIDKVKISESLEIHEITKGACADNFLPTLESLDQVQYVLVQDINEIGIFQYLNKTIVLHPSVEQKDFSTKLQESRHLIYYSNFLESCLVE